MRHDLAQGMGSSTLEVIQILRIVWFFYGLVRLHTNDAHPTPFRCTETEARAAYC